MAHLARTHPSTAEVDKLPTALQKPLKHIWIGRGCYWVIQSSCLHCSVSHSKAIPAGWVSSLALPISSCTTSVLAADSTV